MEFPVGCFEILSLLRTEGFGVVLLPYTLIDSWREQDMVLSLHQDFIL